MRQTLKIILSIIMISLSNLSLFAQVDSGLVSATNAYMKHIDSLARNDQRQKFVRESISEGPITFEIVKKTNIGDQMTLDTTIERGGWGKYTTSNIPDDTVYRIEYHDNIEKNFYLIFYYNKNLLIYSKLDYQEDGIGQTFYKREEYYDKGKIIFVYETKAKIDDKFKERTDINLYNRGSDYCHEFMKDK